MKYPMTVETKFVSTVKRRSFFFPHTGQTLTSIMMWDHTCLSQTFTLWLQSHVVLTFKLFYILGSMTSRLQSPAPRVRKSPRAVASSVGGSTSLSLKPAARNSSELISITRGGRDVSTSGGHSWNVSPDTSSSTLLSHRLMTRTQSPL
jgi:hypothetical protein